MKGIIFTQFIEMIEEKHGFKMADEVVMEANLRKAGPIHQSELTIIKTWFHFL